MSEYHTYRVIIPTGVEIYIKSSEELEENELYAYADHIVDFSSQNSFIHRLNGVTLDFDGDYCDIHYDTGRVPGFNRLRRITGYLVGDVGRWNNGKRAELHDRKKHM